MASKNNILSLVSKERTRIEELSLDNKFAYFSVDARRKFDRSDSLTADFRSPFAHDIDRIIHSHSYARYMDKTQVFFQIKNDHLHM